MGDISGVQDILVLEQFDTNSFPSCNAWAPLPVDANVCHQISGFL